MLLLASCATEGPPDGGDKERALAAATTAFDVQKVRELLASGADPNARIDIEGNSESSWFLALDQLRQNRPDSIAVVKAMLQSGASRTNVWGTHGGARPKESFWKSFMRGGRVAGSGSGSPLRVAMFHPVPEVVRWLTESGFDPRDGEGELVSAIESGEVEIAHILVEAGVNVNCQPTAVTPLVAAIELRSEALMTYLEEHGAREKP
jgi:hypothetical protein